jgi:hypothetical protein
MPSFLTFPYTFMSPHARTAYQVKFTYHTPVCTFIVSLAFDFNFVFLYVCTEELAPADHRYR